MSTNDDPRIPPTELTTPSSTTLLQVNKLNPSSPCRYRSRRRTQQYDSSNERSKILPLNPTSHALLFPRRLCYSGSFPTILVSRCDVLLLPFIMCVVRCDCKYSITNRWEINSFSVDYCEVFSEYYESFNWMEFRY